MSDKNKDINSEDLENVSGGFAGSDAWQEDEYSSYGIYHEHNYASKDKYFDTLTNSFISQRTAERRVQKRRDYEKKTGRKDSWKHAPLQEVT